MYWRILLCVSTVLAYDWQRYEGYKFVHVSPRDADQVKALRKFQESNEILIFKEPRVGRQADYLVSPARLPFFTSLLESKQLEFKISTRDITAELKKEWDGIKKRDFEDMVYDKNQFNTRADIEAEIDNLASQCANVSLTCSTEYLPGPPLHEGQQLKILHMTGGANPRNSILWESMAHAREWLAGATLMNILDKMVKGYGTDEDVTLLVDNYDFHFIPIMNPDGYQYTWDEDRLWRKNRRNNEGSACYGVDLNRNYDNNWSDPGASTEPCSDTYCGPSPASEPETQAVVDFVNTNPGPDWIMDVSMHTYGQYILTPYGNCTYPPNWDTGLRNVTMAGCTAIEQTFDTNWDCGNSCEVLYETSGGSTDWMMETAGMPYTFVPELRGIGFVVDPEQIPYSTEEVWNGLVAMVKTIMVMPSPKRK